MKLIVELSLPADDPTVPQVRQISAPKDWKFSAELQDGELYYRTKLSGSLTLTGDDFIWLQGQYDRFPCCVEVTMNVFTPKCDKSAEGSDDDLFWPGYFLMTAVKWDFYACTATVSSVLPRDGYDALYRCWTNPINVISATQPLDNIPFTAYFANRYFPIVKDDGTTEYVPYPDGNEAGKGPNGYEHTYGRGMDLTAVIDRVFFLSVANTKAAPLGFAVASDFFTLPINPVTKRTNYRRLMLAGSDAKRPASITPAVKLIWTLKDLLDELKGLFNVYHLIDPQTGQLRLEHYSWFAEGTYQPVGKVTMNLKKFPDQLAKANNESVDLDDLYGAEVLTIQNNSGSDFLAFKTGNVRYDDICTVKDDKGQAKTNNISVSRIYTDLLAGYAHADSVPDDSALIVEIVPRGTYPNYESPWSQLVVATNPFSSVTDYTKLIGGGPNGYLTAAMLFIDYHRHGRSFTAGKVNQIKQEDGSYSEGLSMAMLSTTFTRRQEGIVITLCCKDFPLNLNGYIATQRFNGKLGKASFEPSTDLLTLDVVAGSRCQAKVVVPADPKPDCPPAGELLSEREMISYCYDGVTPMATVTIQVFADGHCGEYETGGYSDGVGGC